LLSHTSIHAKETVGQRKELTKKEEVIPAEKELNSKQNSAQITSQVIATIEGENVTEDDVMEYMLPMLRNIPTFKDKKFSDIDESTRWEILKHYVTNKIIQKEAKKLKIEDSAAFQEELKSVKDGIIAQTMLKQYVDKEFKESMIDEEYKKIEQSLKGQKEIKFSHMFFSEESEAQKAKRELNGGVKFEELMKKVSAENEKQNNKRQNSQFDRYFLKDHFSEFGMEEIGAKAFSMKKDQISDPIKMGDGWYIIKLLEVRDAKAPPQNDDIKARLAEMIKQKLRNKLIFDLEKKYTVKYTIN
jgi:foldase protein PrsA